MIPPDPPTFQIDSNGQFVMPKTPLPPTPDQPIKKKRGRPKGTKNPPKPKKQSLLADLSSIVPFKLRQAAHRPQNPIDWELFEKLCACLCTQSEIASMLNIHIDTLRDRAAEFYGDSYSNVYKKFSEDGKCSLRRNQFVLSQTNSSMAIWLGKIWLGQQDPDKVNDLQRAQLDYATQAIKHAEQNIENLSAITQTAASLPGIDGQDQHLAGSSEVRQDVQLNPQDDKAPEGRPEGGCVDCWRDAGLDPTQHT
jgi:hypothetical protein